MQVIDNKKTYDYKFTIIMSIYNVEDYLREAVDSIINQNIGFEENVQLILVNDGSPDNSEEICLEYQEKYPNNVLYVKKENGGLASAKNFGLKYRKGKYVNFFDPDDILSSNTLTEVDKFFERNYNIIPYVAIPLYFFEAQTGLHGKYKFLGNTNRIVNLDAEPYNFTLSSASAFYKTEIFDNIEFDEDMTMSEDVLLNFNILKDYHCFGYVCQGKVRYNYRKREEAYSIVDLYAEDKNNFYILLKIWNKVTNNEKKIPSYVKEYFLYESRSRLREISSTIFEDKEEYEKLLEEYRKIIDKIGVQHIAQVSRMLPSKNSRYIYLSNILREDKTFDLSKNGFFQKDGFNIFPLSNLEVRIADIQFLKKKIRFEVLFWDYNNKDIELFVKNTKGKIYKWKDIKCITCPYDQKYGEFVICPTTVAVFEIPYKRTKFGFYILDKNTGLEYLIKKIDVTRKSKLVLRDREIRIFHGDYGIKHNGDEIAVKCFKTPGKEYNIKSYRHIKEKYGYKAFFRLLNRRKKKYILINDRPQKAGDNGEAVFKYINKNEKALAKKTYFVISNKCEDYKRLKKYGKVVKINSIRHKYMFLNAKAIISSHNHPLFFNAFELDKLKYYQDMFNYKFVWLQHGIIEKDVSKGANRYTGGYDYMVVSTEGERDEVAQDKYLIYDKNRIILNGLPRYDYLKNNPENIITIAPTWRDFLSGAISETGFHETKRGFEDSEYYKRYSGILESKKIHKLLEEKNYKLNFLLHPGMAGYEECFEKFETDRINIIKAEEVNYQKVFEKSKLLITDYSSVAFDFAYLKKPIIYYQFDKEQFFTKHYRPGYFEYERDGLGSVVYGEDEIIDKIEYYFNNDFKLEDEYISRIDKTYKYHDKNNCKRLIDFLLKHKVIKR